MTGFEPWISCVGSDRSTNWATITPLPDSVSYIAMASREHYYEYFSSVRHMPSHRVYGQPATQADQFAVSI